MARDTSLSHPRKNNPIGLALIVVGAILLAIAYLAGWTSSNLVLLAGLALIVVGVILHVKSAKLGDKY